MSWAQVVIGSAGSGKTVYCTGMYNYLLEIKRKVEVVNLDPAQETHPLPYPCAIDVRDLVSVKKVMKQKKIGPNGALLWSMEYLEKKISWLSDKIRSLSDSAGIYFLFDCPGQLELYVHHPGLKKIFAHLEQEHSFTLVLIHLTDALCCQSMEAYIASIFSGLAAIIPFELPFLHVLTKIDNIDPRKLPFALEDLAEAESSLYFLKQTLCEKETNPLNSSFENSKNRISYLMELADILDDLGLVSFQRLDIQERKSVGALLQKIDQTMRYPQPS